MRNEKTLVFAFQATLVFVVVVVSLLNLSLTADNTCLWKYLLTGTLGYVVPGPMLKKKRQMGSPA
jgi:hypothetical protein